MVATAQDSLKEKIDDINEISEASERIHEFKRLLKERDTTQWSEATGTLYYELGRSYYKAKKNEQALSYLLKAMQHQRQFSDKESLHKSMFLAGFVYEQQDKIEKAQQQFLEIVNNQGSDKYTCNTYRKLAIMAANNGDYYKALQYLNEGLANVELCKNLEFENQLTIAALSIYGQIYEDAAKKATNFDDLKRIRLYEKIIEKNIQTVEISAEKLAAAYANIAVVYDSFLKLDEALSYGKKAQKIYKEIGDKPNELQVVLNIGILYSKKENHQRANQQYQRVIDESEDIGQIATAYESKGYYLPTKKIEEKLWYIEKAIGISVGQKAAFQLPTSAQLQESEYKRDLFIYLIDLADLYVKAYEQNLDTTYLYKAKQIVILVDKLVSRIRYVMDTEASKLFWIENGVDVYMQAVKICYLLKDVETAFYFMEKNKALLLQENIKVLQTKFASDVPSDQLEREHQLKYEVLNMQEQFQQHLDDATWKAKYTLKNQEYKSFMDSLKQAFPKYAKTKETVTIVPVAEVLKAYKDKNTAFVEYILHETDGYGIYYDEKEPIFFQISDVVKFQEQLEKWRSFLQKRTMDSYQVQTFQTLGNELFQQLFPFENAAERLQDKQLTIVPDHTVQYIPFEALSMRKTGKISKNYLVNTVEIAYLQSFSLFEQIQKKKNNPTYKLLAIAPETFNDSALPTLTGTANMLEFLARYDAVQLLTKEEASKENFIQHRNDFDIIHLNTHAGLDSISKIPWLSFHDEKVSMYELFGLENQAALVILDACKTNDGKRLSGEGIINLSRGFFYNGTQSVLASQWNVNEQAGNEILKTFYIELENGHTRSKALQLAKKTYLQQHKNTQNLPYYWAAFTLTGQTDMITLQKDLNYMYVYFGLGILLLLGLLVGYRKKLF